MVVSLNRYRVSAGRVCWIVVDGYARALFIYIGLQGKFLSGSYSFFFEIALWIFFF